MENLMILNLKYNGIQTTCTKCTKEQTNGKRKKMKQIKITSKLVDKYVDEQFKVQPHEEIRVMMIL